MQVFVLNAVLEAFWNIFRVVYLDHVVAVCVVFKEQTK